MNCAYCGCVTTCNRRFCNGCYPYLGSLQTKVDNGDPTAIAAAVAQLHHHRSSNCSPATCRPTVTFLVEPESETPELRSVARWLIDLWHTIKRTLKKALP